MKFNVEGIVIRQSPYKEKDAMISVVTKDGIVSFLARSVLSINSKNKSCCLPFSYSQFTLNSKADKLSLIQGKCVKTYSHFYESLEKLSSVNLINEAIVKFIDEDNAEIFPYLKNYLELLDRGFDEATLTVIMLAQIVKHSGYDLEYSACVRCRGKKDIVGVSFPEGGFICRSCADLSTELRSENYLKTFRYIFMVPFDKMAHHVIDGGLALSLIRELCDFLSESFGFREIKSLEIYRTTHS